VEAKNFSSFADRQAGSDENIFHNSFYSKREIYIKMVYRDHTSRDSDGRGAAPDVAHPSYIHTSTNTW
jgi:hypothetical protein